MASPSIPKDPVKRIPPGAFPPKFHQTKSYKRPLEVWPVEFEEFERLVCASRGHIRHALKAIFSRLMDLSSLWNERYQEKAKGAGDRETGPDYFNRKEK